MYVSFQERVDSGIEQEGSNLSGVSGRCCWDELPQNGCNLNEENKENQLRVEERRCSLERPHISDLGKITTTICVIIFRVFFPSPPQFVQNTVNCGVQVDNF